MTTKTYSKKDFSAALKDMISQIDSYIAIAPDDDMMEEGKVLLQKINKVGENVMELCNIAESFGLSRESVAESLSAIGGYKYIVGLICVRFYRKYCLPFVRINNQMGGYYEVRNNKEFLTNFKKNLVKRFGNSYVVESNQTISNYTLSPYDQPDSQNKIVIKKNLPKKVDNSNESLFTNLLPFCYDGTIEEKREKLGEPVVDVNGKFTIATDGMVMVFVNQNIGRNNLSVKNGDFGTQLVIEGKKDLANMDIVYPRYQKIMTAYQIAPDASCLEMKTGEYYCFNINTKNFGKKLNMAKSLYETCFVNNKDRGVNIALSQGAGKTLEFYSYLGDKNQDAFYSTDEVENSEVLTKIKLIRFVDLFNFAQKIGINTLNIFIKKFDQNYPILFSGNDNKILGIIMPVRS
jgi:hypothetical protein